MEKQTSAHVPGTEFGHDCIFCADDMERADGRDKV